jgi:hypothetical protein
MSSRLLCRLQADPGGPWYGGRAQKPRLFGVLTTKFADVCAEYSLSTRICAPALLGSCHPCLHVLIRLLLLLLCPHQKMVR